MKHLFTALLLSASLAQAAQESNDWETNDSGYLVRQAAETQDFMGINICQSMIVFASPAEPEDEGKTIQLSLVMRVDTEGPWDARMIVRVNEGLALGGLALDPLLLKEMIQGKNLRIKWGDSVYSRFDLSGLTSELKRVKCDSEFFESDKKPGDADFFS